MRMTTMMALLAAGALAAVIHGAGGRADRSGMLHAKTAAAGAATSPTGQDTIALGRQVFLGKSGGAICATCHGQNAKGLPGLGPDLTDATWLHGDGSIAFLKAIIRTGVAKPKQSPTVMPPYGGTPLKPEQLDAVAAYIHSLSR